MSDQAEQAAAIIERLARVADLLPEWEIEVSSCDEQDTAAQVVFAENRHAARIETGPDWPDDSPRQEHTIGHELAHLLLHDLHRVAWTAAARLPKGERRLVRDELLAQEEQLCDRLGRLIVKTAQQAHAEGDEAHAAWCPRRCVCKAFTADAFTADLSSENVCNCKHEVAA